MALIKVSQLMRADRTKTKKPENMGAFHFSAAMIDATKDLETPLKQLCLWFVFAVFAVLR